MTMQPNHHPDEERLAAFADGHPDLELRLHLRDCGRCRSIVDELTMLRAALAELPDLAPSRPLRLLPEVLAPEPSAAERLAGWTRRAFMPLLAAGFGLAIVGSVGTLGSSFTLGGASGAAPAFDPAIALADGSFRGRGTDRGDAAPALDRPTARRLARRPQATRRQISAAMSLCGALAPSVPRFRWHCR